jgi:hypothetical protein
MPGTLTTPRDQTCPAQRTGQQPARARKTTSISSQNMMLRITVVRLLAGIVNRTTPISKQKMFRFWELGTGEWAISLLVDGEERAASHKTRKSPFHPPLQKGERGGFVLSVFSRPYTLVPGPFFLCTQALYFSKIAIASISISVSGLTSAFTTTPVAAGKPFLKYFLRTAAVSL